ncbi:MAG: glycosyltransferase family 4 protein [Chloroflexota bacterium]|nr:glycosyltransferase family 4 protein [Chloroflexota bacterium]
MKVLYVNHTSRISGGERSLLDLLGALPEHVAPAVACPAGPLADALRVPWRRMPSIDASLRLHPLHTPHGLVMLIAAALAVRRAAARMRADLLHANSVRAGLVTGIAARLGAPPAIVHVRDCLPPAAASAASMRLLASGARVVLVNSDYTWRSVEALIGAGRAPLRVVHSPVDVDRFDPDRHDPRAARAALGISPDAPVLAVVAQLTPWKGQDDAIRIVARLKRTHPGVRLLLIGTATFSGRSTRHDNQAYVRRLHTLIAEQDVTREVVLLGERADVPALLRCVDVLLVPSWEEPFGRAVVEGMAMGVPVVATSVGGPAEILRDHVDGLLLAPRRPALWAAEIDALLADPNRRSSMGSSARRRALERFGLDGHVNAVLAAYGEALAGRRR